jgi:2-methylaconitate cis-trans-isomerase PrpF
VVAATIPALLMRGGTSKGVFVHIADLPPPGPTRDAVVLDLMGSPDPMQIDGLGGTYSSTSKLVAVEPGVAPDDITYWFAQVGVDEAVVDWSGNCGNLTTAVGPFAIDEGLVPAVEPVTKVRLRNGNTGVAVLAEVPVRDRRARVDGDLVVPGVPGRGAPVATRYLDPGGGVLGAALPTGRTADTLPTTDGPVAASLVDITHPYAIIELGAAGLRAGDLDPTALNQDGALLARLEAIRGAAATALGVVTAPGEAAARSPAVPRLLLVADPDSPDADLVTLAVTMGRVHRALPMTAALCGAAACQITGTVAARACGDAPGDVVRLRHPKGIVEILVDADGPAIRSVGVVRTARRLMAGTVYLRGQPEQ